jgi:hypothetical protein
LAKGPQCPIHRLSDRPPRRRARSGRESVESCDPYCLGPQIYKLIFALQCCKQPLRADTTENVPKRDNFVSLAA